MRRPRVIVVGGGAAGLVGAILARRAGCEVTLLEAGRSPGGRARTEEAEGFLFNLGPRALYRAGAARRILVGIGVPCSGRPPLRGGLALLGEALHRLPVGPWSLLRTGALSGRGKREMLVLLAGLGRLRTEDFDGVSVAAWLSRRFRDPSARALMGALFRLATYGADHELTSAGAALHQLRLAVQENVLYLDGGWQSIVDGLVKIAAGEGVELHAGKRARSLAVKEGRVDAVVCADGATLSAERVLCAVDPATAVELAGAPVATLAGAPRGLPVRSACLDLGLSRLPVASQNFALGIDRPTYLSVHSAVAKLTPSGGALVHVARYLRRDEDGSEALPELEAEMDRVQPGWRAEVVARKWRPNMIVTHGIPTAEGRGTAGRPDVRDPDVSGLYYAGDWVGAEGLLLDAAVASAAAAAEALSEDPLPEGA